MTGENVYEGWGKRVTEVEIVQGRHDERIKDLERSICSMDKKLNKIYTILLTLAGGIVVSALLLLINLAILGKAGN